MLCSLINLAERKSMPSTHISVFVLLLVKNPEKKPKIISHNFFEKHFLDNSCCGQEAQFQSALEVQALMEVKRRPGSLLIFTGDLNVEDGFEKSKTILYLKGLLSSAMCPVLLEDTFRVANGEEADGTTFPNTGKIDYIFANPPGTQVMSAAIDRKDYGSASDHWPINAIIKV